MSLTRKDFIRLAETTAKILRYITIEEKNLKIEHDTAENLKKVIENYIIGFCSEQNSLFDVERFKNKINENLN